jgi:hypothetical protein
MYGVWRPRRASDHQQGRGDVGAPEDVTEFGAQIISTVVSPSIFRLLKYLGTGAEVDETTAAAIVGTTDNGSRMLTIIMLAAIDVLSFQVYEQRKCFAIGARGRDILEMCKRVGAISQTAPDRSWDDVISIKPRG